MEIESGKQAEQAKKFVTALNIAISNCCLYARDHSLIEESGRKTFSILNELLQEPVEMMVIDDDLVINKMPMREGTMQAKSLVRRFTRKSISRVDFLAGITPSEFNQFIITMSQSDSALCAFPHIRTGLVDVSTGRLKTESPLLEQDLNRFKAEQIERLKAVYQNITPLKQIKLTELEDIVSRFVSTLGREISVLKLLSPVKSYSNYTYVHSINVSILSIFMAESLGLRGKLLHDIGLAALLHDVGKLFIEKDILEKNGPLDEQEFAAMTNHPAYGTAYLARIEGIASIVPIVSFEHHRKFDGTGYPKLKMGEKKQHPGSQIVAIADVFDALRSFRPYRKSLTKDEVLAIMKKGAGTDFNPFLVDNFISAFMKATKKKGNEGMS
jgi:HD-GYP domain-containing protein (c-di-GMP phosphodiesterase class II)